jgi:hypothetical protein
MAQNSGEQPQGAAERRAGRAPVALPDFPASQNYCGAERWATWVPAGQKSSRPDIRQAGISAFAATPVLAGSSA